MTPEGKVKAEIKRILKKHNAYYFMPQPGFTCRSGIPDFICCVNGHFLAIEAKAESKQPTALQQQELDKITAVGGIGVCINIDNIATLDTLINGLKTKRFGASFSSYIVDYK